jgi:hypothetical protein
MLHNIDVFSPSGDGAVMMVSKNLMAFVDEVK